MEASTRRGAAYSAASAARRSASSSGGQVATSSPSSAKNRSNPVGQMISSRCAGSGPAFQNLVYLREARDVLLAGWPKRAARRPLLRAVVGLAVDFRTWQTLCRREELDDRTAVALMVRLVAAVAGSSRAAPAGKAKRDHRVAGEAAAP